MTYMSGEVSNAPNSFDIFPRIKVTVKEESKKQLIAEVIPEIKEEQILAEPVIEELTEAPVLTEAVTEPAAEFKKQTTKKKKSN